MERAFRFLKIIGPCLFSLNLFLFILRRSWCGRYPTNNLGFCLDFTPGKKEVKNEVLGIFMLESINFKVKSRLSLTLINTLPLTIKAKQAELSRYSISSIRAYRKAVDITKYDFFTEICRFLSWIKHVVKNECGGRVFLVKWLALVVPPVNMKKYSICQKFLLYGQKM